MESITSVLPLCDEFIVAVGNSDDETEQLISSIPSGKIRIVKTTWDDTLRKGGRVLAVETDKALHQISADADWAFYIQADEVLHEDSIETVRDAMLKWKDDKNVEGLLFNYLHFYGSYGYVADAFNWYRNEIRVIKPGDVFSYRDAQGFRKRPNQKLNVKRTGAVIHHYGWVKHPNAQQRKQESFHKMWHDDAWMEQNVIKASEYDYNQIDSLKLFTGTHPAVMQKRIEQCNWKFEFDTSRSRMKLKYRLRRWIENNFGISPGEYRNYRVV